MQLAHQPQELSTDKAWLIHGHWMLTVAPSPLNCTQLPQMTYLHVVLCLCIMLPLNILSSIMQLNSNCQMVRKRITTFLSSLDITGFSVQLKKQPSIILMVSSVHSIPAGIYKSKNNAGLQPGHRMGNLFRLIPVTVEIPILNGWSYTLSSKSESERRYHY